MLFRLGKTGKEKMYLTLFSGEGFTALFGRQDRPG